MTQDSAFRRAGWLLPAAVLLGFAVYWPLLTGSTPSARDMPFYFFPTKAALGEALQQGQIPWIDRHRWGGMPLLGSPAYAPFYPLNILFAFLPLGVAMNAWLLIHLAVAVTGFSRFARQLGTSAAGAAVAGLLWGLSGPMVSMAVFPPTYASLALFPWFLAAVLRLLEAPHGGNTIRAGVCAALVVTAGIPEFVLILAFSSLALLFHYWLVTPPGRDRNLTPRLIAGAGAGCLAAALTAPVLVSWIRTASVGIRGAFAGLGTQLASQNALPPFRWIDLLMDGRVCDWTVRALTLGDGTIHYPYVPSITLGLIGTALGLCGLVAGGRRALAPAGMAVTGFLLALGPATPLWELLIRVAPPLKGLRYPEKWVFLTLAGLAWLAVLALAQLEKRLESRVLRFFAAALLAGIALERGGIASDLIDPLPATYLSKGPPVLAGFPLASEDAPRPRLFHANSALELPLYDAGDLRKTNLWARASLGPGFASLFGASYIFEDDFDLTLPMEALQWTRLVSEAGKARHPVLKEFARYAGVSAVVSSQLSADRRWIPGLEKLEPAWAPYRFAGEVVSDPSQARLLDAFLSDGADPRKAYVEGPPGRREVPQAVLLGAFDRPDGLRLHVRNDAKEPAFLMLLRMRTTVEEASIDGRPLDVVPMSFGFAGCWIPPGEHRLLFRPETGWLGWSLVPPVLALCLAGATLWHRRRASEGGEMGTEKA